MHLSAKNNLLRRILTDAKQTYCALLCSLKTNILSYIGLNVIIEYLSVLEGHLKYSYALWTADLDSRLDFYAVKSVSFLN